MNQHFGSDFDDFLFEVGLLEHCNIVAEQRIKLLQLALGEWVMICPMCGQILRKNDPEQPWECECGYSTKKE